MFLTCATCMLFMFSSCGDQLAVDEELVDVNQFQMLDHEPLDLSSLSNECGFNGAAGHGTIRRGTKVQRFSYHYNPHHSFYQKFTIINFNGDKYSGRFTNGEATRGNSKSHTLYGEILKKNKERLTDWYIEIYATDNAKRGKNKDHFRFLIKERNRIRTGGHGVISAGDINNVFNTCSSGS